MSKRISAGRRLAPVAVSAALLVLAGGAVVAVDAQPQDEQATLEKARAAELKAAAELAHAAQRDIEHAYRAALEATRAASEEAWAESRALLESSLATTKEAWAQSHAERARHAQELRERLVRSPRLAIRGLRGHLWGGMVDRVLAMSEELELTEAQEDQIRAARRSHQRDEIERDAQLEVAELDLDELLEDRATADLAAVEQVMQRRADLRVQGEMARLRLAQEVWGVLTAEQRETLEEHKASGFVIRGGPNALYFDGDGEFEIFGGDGVFGDHRVFDFAEPFFLRHFGRHDDLHFDHEDEEGDDEGEASGAAIGISRLPATGVRIDL